MADTINYDKFKYQNNLYAFIVVIIDCFTRKVWAVPIRRVNGEQTADALKSVLKQNPSQYPAHLVTDEGTEFFNKDVAPVLANFGVHHFHARTRSPSKASMAERVIRTLKSRLAKYMYLHKTTRWIDALPELVRNYNETPHSVTGVAPNSIDDTNWRDIKGGGGGDGGTVQIRLNIGDRVRILKPKSLFAKGYSQTWSDQVYKISKALKSKTVDYYRVASLDDTRLPGFYYYYQLNLVAKAAAAADDADPTATAAAASVNEDVNDDDDSD